MSCRGPVLFAVVTRSDSHRLRDPSRRSGEHSFVRLRLPTSCQRRSGHMVFSGCRRVRPDPQSPWSATQRATYKADVGGSSPSASTLVRAGFRPVRRIACQREPTDRGESPLRCPLVAGHKRFRAGAWRLTFEVRQTRSRAIASCAARAGRATPRRRRRPWPSTTCHSSSRRAAHGRGRPDDTVSKSASTRPTRTPRE
jgi:hypothetical protein